MGKHPKKSSMKRFTAIASIVLITVVCWTDSRLDKWENNISDYEQGILNQEPSLYKLKQTWDDLPSCVQRYLKRVSPESQHSVRSLSLQQEGEFLIKEGSFVPFTAHQVISSNPPGFSWEASVGAATWAPDWFPKIRLSDAYVAGIGHFKASLAGIFPLTCMHQEDNLMITTGQALRWLAETVMVPSILFPEAGIVTWTAVEGMSNKAILSLHFSDDDLNSVGSEIHLEATFDEEGWLKQLIGKRPFMNKDSSFAMKYWRADFKDYQEVEHTWVPRTMESGWIDGQNFEVHFKTTNVALQYQANTETTATD